MTSGGLGYTDIGNKYAIGGIELDFYRRMGKHYGRFKPWIFEPSVVVSDIQAKNISVSFKPEKNSCIVKK